MDSVDISTVLVAIRSMLSVFNIMEGLKTVSARHSHAADRGAPVMGCLRLLTLAAALLSSSALAAPSDPVALEPLLQAIDPPDPTVDSEGWKTTMEQLKDLEGAVAALPSPQRAAGELHLMEGWLKMNEALLGAPCPEEFSPPVCTVWFEQVTDTEDDPFGYDLTTTDLLAHPAVAFPGADAVWFGAYDKATGELIEVGRFE